MMKLKGAAFVLSALTALLVAGCDNEHHATANKQPFSVEIYKDYVTGCEYVNGGGYGGLTPRVDGTGAHIGCN